MLWAPEACAATSIRWNIENDINGNTALSHLTTAFATGMKVILKLVIVAIHHKIITLPLGGGI